jgi:hypothetical protein
MTTKTLTINEDNWPVFSRRIASPAAPEDFVEASVEILMDYIHPWIVDVKNVRSQFNAINRIQMIEFDNDRDREYYQSAVERYYEEVNKIQDSDSANKGFMLLVEWLKLRQAAEFVRHKYFARKMVAAVKEGYAAVCACNFKATPAATILELHNTFKVQREDISIIWGGDRAYSGDDSQKYSMQEIEDILEKLMRNEPVEKAVTKAVRLQLQAQNAGLGQIPSYLKLGPQNFKLRQEEIDRFQSGKSKYCFFLFKSGGVGLSLHHSDQLTREKVRRNAKNGYAMVEDIPKIPTRPRATFLAPTYSAIELVQGLGRAPRIASLSDTIQTLVFYKGTIEESVARVTSSKLRCLAKVVRQKENWEDLILNNKGVESRDTALRNDKVPDEESFDGRELFEIDDIGEDEDEQDTKD